MKLRILDRLSIANMLEQRGNMMTIAIQRDIRKKILVTAEEREAVQMVEEQGPQGDMRMRWSDKNDAEKEFEFTAAEMLQMKKCAKSVDQRGQVNEENFNVVKMLLDVSENPPEPTPEPPVVAELAEDD